MSALEVILIVMAVELATIAALFAVLMVTRGRRSGVRVGHRRRSWDGLLPEALAGHHPAVSEIKGSLRSPRAFSMFHEYFDEQLRNQRTTSIVRFRQLSRAVGLTHHLHRQLGWSRDGLKQAAAARTLARLEETIPHEKVFALLDSKDDAVVLVAGYASASLGEPHQYLRVFRAVYQKTRITLHGTAELLSRFGDGICPVIHGLVDKIIEQYEQDRPESSVDLTHEFWRDEQGAQVVMIDLLGFFGYQAATDSLLRLLALSEHDEVLIHIVKALSKTGDATAIPKLQEMSSSDNWVLRSQAAQSLAALGAAGAASQIEALVEDDDLRVRVHARRALHSLEMLDPQEVFERACS